jgi:hemin uptake protein HemP
VDDARAAGDSPEGSSDAAPDGAPRVVTSESLLNGATRLAILHDRTLYYLRQTRYGKLILTK